MPKKPCHHRVKTHAIYTVAEAASACDVCRQTVIRWINHHGLAAERGQKPWLIPGVDLKAFLEERRRRAKVRLKPGEIYCLPCRGPIRPALGIADYVPDGPTTGVLVGVCPTCDRLVHRFVAASDLSIASGDLDVAIRAAVPRLNGAY